MRNWFSAVVLGFAFLLALPAHAKSCNISLSLGISNYSFNSGSQQQLLVTVKKNAGAGCNYFIGFSKGSGPSYANREMFQGSSAIPYQLYQSNPFNYVLEDVPQANSDTFVLSGSFSAGPSASQTLSYWAVLGKFSYPLWGTYKDTVTLTLYSGTVNGRYKVVQTQAMTFQYNEPKAIDLSLVPSGSAFDINSTAISLNFGTLSQGETLGFDATVMYNAGYALSIASQNKGNMVLNGGTSTVPYALTANGVPVSLSTGNPAQISTGSGASGSTAARVPIAVTIGSPGTALAGSYSDFLTLTVTSTE